MKYVKVNKVPKKVIGNANSSLYVYCKLKLETRSSQSLAWKTKKKLKKKPSTRRTLSFILIRVPYP